MSEPVTEGVLVGTMVLATLAAARAALVARGSATATARLADPSPRTGRSSCAPLRLRAPPWVASGLADAGLDLSAGQAWSAWMATAVAAVAAAVAIGGPGLGVVVAGVAVVGPVAGWRLLRHRGQARMEAVLPAIVEDVARGLRSGASLRQAIAEAAPRAPGQLGDDLARVARVADHGATLVSSLEDWARRRPLAGVRLVVAALCLGAETGGARAQAVDGVAATLRQRIAAQSEARALATQARVSAAVIAAAPVAFCAVASATDARTLDFLLRTVPGLAFLSAGLALDVLGALWMARLTRIEP